MLVQDFLTFLIEALVVGFFGIMVLDFLIEVKKLWLCSKAFVSTQSASVANTGEFQIPDPWMLPDPVIAPQPNLLVEPEIKLLLLLPQTKKIITQPPLSISESSLKDLAGINLDTLQLRPARKMAKLLGISQKVNGRDQPLSWLRVQIKAKLQSSDLPSNSFQEARWSLCEPPQASLAAS